MGCERVAVMQCLQPDIAVSTTTVLKNTCLHVLPMAKLNFKVTELGQTNVQGLIALECHLQVKLSCSCSRHWRNISMYSRGDSAGWSRSGPQAGPSWVGILQWITSIPMFKERCLCIVISTSQIPIFCTVDETCPIQCILLPPAQEFLTVSTAASPSCVASYSGCAHAASCPRSMFPMNLLAMPWWRLFDSGNSTWEAGP